MALPPLMVGTVHLVTVLVCLIISVSFIGFLALRQRRCEAKRHPGILVGPAVWLGLAGCAAALLHLVPLPAGLIKLIAPATHGVLQTSLGGLGLFGSADWSALSLDPGTTAFEALRAIGVVATLVAAAQCTYRRSQATSLMRLAVGIAGGLALLFLAQTLLGFKNPLFGLYVPSGGTCGSLLRSSFVNANHLAGYLLFNAVIGLGLVVSVEEEGERRLWIGATVLLSAGVFLSLSRGGIVALMLASGVFALVGLSNRPSSRRDGTDDGAQDPGAEAEGVAGGGAGATGSKRQRRTRNRSAKHRKLVMKLVWILVVVAGVVTVVAYDPLKKEALLTVEQSKRGGAKPWGDSLNVVQAHLGLGVGKGALPVAVTRFANRDSVAHTVTHAENFVLQAAVDWGVPLALLMLGGLVYLLVWMIRRTRTSLDKAVVVAFGALLAHNLVDFNLEIGGIAFPVAVVLGAWYGSRGHRLRSWSGGRRFLMPALVVAALVLGPLLTIKAARSGWRRVAKRWAKVSASRTYSKDIKAMVRDHPADYLVHLLAARREAYATPWRPGKALDWLARGKALNPRSAEYHLMYAHVLGRLKLRSFAARHYCRAYRDRPQTIAYVRRVVWEHGVGVELIWS